MAEPDFQKDPSFIGTSKEMEPIRHSFYGAACQLAGEDFLESRRRYVTRTDMFGDPDSGDYMTTYKAQKLVSVSGIGITAIRYTLTFEHVSEPEDKEKVVALAQNWGEYASLDPDSDLTDRPGIYDIDAEEGWQGSCLIAEKTSLTFGTKPTTRTPEKVTSYELWDDSGNQIVLYPIDHYGRTKHPVDDLPPNSDSETVWSEDLAELEKQLVATFDVEDVARIRTAFENFGFETGF